MSGELLRATSDVLARLEPAYREWERRHPGAPREPARVHTLYAGAHRIEPGFVAAAGAEARRLFGRHAATPEELARLLQWPDDDLTAAVHKRVSDKLESEPVEDLRVDFEDGYGMRPHAEEDSHARAVADALAADSVQRWGIRIKPLTPQLAPRAIATLDGLTSQLSSAALAQASSSLCPRSRLWSRSRPPLRCSPSSSGCTGSRRGRSDSSS